LVDKVFVACDTSKSGSVSKSELYVGLLSVHVTLARYAGPAACFVSTRKCRRSTKFPALPMPLFRRLIRSY
jgi:hypothetical protein